MGTGDVITMKVTKSRRPALAGSSVKERKSSGKEFTGKELTGKEF